MHTDKWIKQVLCLIVTGLLAMCSGGLLAAGSEEMFSVELGQRQLFLDDFGIARMVNLKRTMHQTAKKGAVIRPSSMSRHFKLEAPRLGTLKQKYSSCG